MQRIFSRVLIKEKSNKILVVQDRADVWHFPGGKKELGETPLECAKREVKEEIGLDFYNLTEINNGDFYFGDVQWRGYFYFENSVSCIPPINELDQIKGIRFINDLEIVKFPSELSKIIYQMV